MAFVNNKFKIYYEINEMNFGKNFEIEKNKGWIEVRINQDTVYFWKKTMNKIVFL